MKYIIRLASCGPSGQGEAGYEAAQGDDCRPDHFANLAQSFYNFIKQLIVYPPILPEGLCRIHLKIKNAH